MEIKAQEIFQVLDELLVNIGLQLEEYDFTFLTQAELYVEMFKVMFPTLVPMLDIDFSQDDVNDAELIQSLIDFLSKYIIKMDLDHISGDLIANGDAKHILNFLQLLLEISKMIIQKEEEEIEEIEERPVNHQKSKKGKVIKSSPTSFGRPSNQSENSLEDWQTVKYNTVQGISAEFVDESIPEQDEADPGQVEGDSCVEEIATYLDPRVGRKVPNKAPHDPKRPQGKFESLRNSYSGSRISEVSKSKECSDYEMTAKKLSGVDHQFEDFGPKTDPERPKRLEEVGWDGREYEEHEDDEEIVEEAEEDEEDEQGEEEKIEHKNRASAYERKVNKARVPEFQEGEYEESEEEVENHSDHLEEQFVQHPVSKESEDFEDAEYYHPDPINYPNQNKASRNRQIEEGEDDQEDDEQEHEHGYEETPQESYYEEQGNQTEPSQNEDQVIEKKINNYRHQEKNSGRRIQGKQMKARPKTTQKLQGKVEYRPLRPTSANMVYKMKNQQNDKITLTNKISVSKTKKVKSKKLDGKYQEESRSMSNRNNYSEEKFSEKSQGSGRHQTESHSSSYKGRNKEKRIDNSVYKHNMDRNKQQKKLDDTKFSKKTIIKVKGESLKKAYEDQQKRLYYNIRDTKLNYLKKIHTIIFQLEKEKIKEENEAYMNYKKTQDEFALNVLFTIKRDYQEKLDALKRGYKNERNERKMNEIAQNTFVNTLKHELKLDQMKEIERLKDRFTQEKMRFDLMTGDEAYLEKKLAQLYQK